MGMLRFNYRSQALGRYVDISVVYPTDELSYFDPLTSDKQEYGRNTAHGKALYRPGMKFQTVYLLHGGGDDDSLTYRYTNAERYAQRNRVMLVTPNIANSFGIDTAYGVAYQTFLSQELPTVIRALFASSEKREDNFIMGYAMGGNVALGTALMHPELYAACVDISGGIGMTMSTETMVQELDSDHFRNKFRLYCTSFGPSETFPGSPFDLAAQARKHPARGDSACRFFIACGSEEFIRSRVVEDVRLLRQAGYQVDYELAQGYDHDFRMWDTYIQKALDEFLPLKRQVIYPDEFQEQVR